MSKCPQCGNQTNRQNPLRKNYYNNEPKICRECCQSNHIRRYIAGIR